MYWAVYFGLSLEPNNGPLMSGPAQRLAQQISPRSPSLIKTPSISKPLLSLCRSPPLHGQPPLPSATNGCRRARRRLSRPPGAASNSIATPPVLRFTSYAASRREHRVRPLHGAAAGLLLLAAAVRAGRGPCSDGDGAAVSRVRLRALAHRHGQARRRGRLQAADDRLLH